MKTHSHPVILTQKAASHKKEKLLLFLKFRNLEYVGIVHEKGFFYC